MHKYLLGLLLALSSATPVVIAGAGPAEAKPKVIHVPVIQRAQCPRGLVGRYPNCQKPTPVQRRCLKAVGVKGAGNSIKLKCVQWGSLAVAATSRG